MKVTQRDRILHLMQAHAGEWIPAVKLSFISLRYGARILELRKLGYEIELRKEYVKGVCHSSYRLIYALETPQDALQTLLEGWHERVTSPHKEGMNEESVVGPSTTSRHGGVSGNLHAH